MSRADPSGSRRPRRYPAQIVFFPAAALHAAVVAPLSVHGMTIGPPVLPGLAAAAHHAHELLFGFALAVVTGFLVNRARPMTIGLLFGLWLAGRVAFLLGPMTLASALANAGFAVVLASVAVPPFMKAAKKWRNRAIGPILLVVGGSVLAYHLAAGLELGPHLPTVLRLAVLALALLMLFMGGRIVAPAAAGHIRRQGGHLEPRVQPRLEGAQLLLVGAGALALPSTPAAPLAGLLLIAASGVTLVRLARWRLWRCRARDDLVCIGVGQAWLVAALALLGTGLLTGRPMLTTAVHAVTVGALGTLTITVMARTWRLRLGHGPGNLPAVRPAVAAIALAALLRIAWPTNIGGLLIAACLWSVAFLLLLLTLTLGSRSAPTDAHSDRNARRA